MSADAFLVHTKEEKKEKEKENFMVLKQRKTVLIVSALLTAQMVMQEAVQAFEEVSQPEVQITETAQEGELVSQSDGDDIWTETYTYVSDTNTPHAFAETVEKQGDWYAMKDVEYQVTELTTQLTKKRSNVGICIV